MSKVTKGVGQMKGRIKKNNSTKENIVTTLVKISYNI
jgi:hypothetical protein